MPCNPQILKSSNPQILKSSKNSVKTFAHLSSPLSTVLLLASAFASSQAWAATITSAQSGDWADTTTWVGGVVPGAADNAVIDAGHTVTITTLRNITDVTLSTATSTLALQSSGYLRINGTVNNSNGGTWTTPAAGTTVSFTNEAGQNNLSGFMKFANLRLAGGTNAVPTAGATLSMPANVFVTGNVTQCMTVSGGNYVTVGTTQIVLTGHVGLGGCGTLSPESTKNITLALQPVSHTINIANTMKLAGMSWFSPLTAPVTLNFTGGTVDVGTASLAGLSGASATNFVTLRGGTLNGTGVISNCQQDATTPTTLTGGVTCVAPISNPVNAPIDFSFNHKPVETTPSEIELK